MKRTTDLIGCSFRLKALSVYSVERSLRLLRYAPRFRGDKVYCVHCVKLPAFAGTRFIAFIEFIEFIAFVEFIELIEFIEFIYLLQPATCPL